MISKRQLMSGKTMTNIRPEHACPDLPQNPRDMKGFSKAFFRKPRVQATLQTLIAVIEEVDRWHVEESTDDWNPKGVHSEELAELINHIRRIKRNAHSN